MLAATNTTQFFVGAKGGFQSAQDDKYNHSNPEGTIFGLYGGLQWTPSWRWDLGYQYHDKLKADATSVNVKTWLIDSALRYDWHLYDSLSLYGRLGAAYWNMEKTPLSSNKSDANGFSPLGEMGINYHINTNLQLSAGYQYIHGIGKSYSGKYDSHGVLASLTYTFGDAEQRTFVETAPIPMTETNPVKAAGNVQTEPLSSSPKTTYATFGFDAIKPNQELIEQLTETSSVLNAYPQAHVIVVGHTDSTGSEPYNQTLSERRAHAVVNKLIKLNVSPKQIEWRGEGESQPIADNNTVEGRAKNRRVEIITPRFLLQE